MILLHFHFSPVFSFWQPSHFLCIILRPPAFFYQKFLLHSYHHLLPSERSFRCSADTQPILLQQQQVKEPPPKLPQSLSRSGTSFSLPACLFFLILSSSHRKEAYDPLFAPFTPTPSSALHLLLVLALLFLPLLFLSLFLNAPPLYFVASAV